MTGWLMAACVLVAAGLFAWVVQQLLVQAMARYRRLFKENARVQMSELFLFLDPEQLWAANLAVAAITSALVAVLFRSPWMVAACAALCLWLPRVAVNWLRRRRLQRFDEQLPDALLALCAALGAGVSLQSGLARIVAESPAPLGQEMSLVLREQRFGVTQDEALAHLFDRVPTQATDLVVSVLRIATDTGGNLTETLERIAHTLRARSQMEARITALTSQGRLQARVVGALPLLLALALYRLDPEAMSQLWSSAGGWAVLIVVVLLELSGWWLIRRIVRIDV